MPPKQSIAHAMAVILHAFGCPVAHHLCHVTQATTSDSSTLQGTERGVHEHANAYQLNRGPVADVLMPSSPYTYQDSARTLRSADVYLLLLHW